MIVGKENAGRVGGSKLMSLNSGLTMIGNAQYLIHTDVQQVLYGMI